MSLIAGGHEETERNWPGPLDRGGLRGLGALALPAVLLSAASILVFAVVLVFVQRNAELRTMFSLELGGVAAFPEAVIILAAALAWWIAARCRNRPGPLWPRLWALFLAGLSSLVAVALVSGLRPDLGPLQQALALACSAAAATLAPRLLPLHPDSPWVQRIAPASLAFVLLAVLPIAYYLGSDTVGNRVQRLRSKLGEIDRQIEGLRECVQPGCSPGQYEPAAALLGRLADTPLLWESAAALEGEYGLGSRLNRAVSELSEVLAPAISADWFRRIGAAWPGDAGAAEQRVRQIETLRLDPLNALLRASAKINRPEPARRALETAATVVIAALGPDVAPKLRLAPVIYVPGEGPYERDDREFPAASARIVRYFRQVGRLFGELNQAAEPQELAGVTSRGSVSWRRDWDKQMAALEASWADHWVLPFLEPGPAAPSPGLSQVLAMPVLDDLAAANLHGLLELSKGRAQALLDQGRAANCEPATGNREGPGTPYTFSLRCRAYVPGPIPEQTALRVELRLIYQDVRPISPAAKPHRLYFIFPVPAGESPDGYRQQVRNALAEARTRVRDPFPKDAFPACAVPAPTGSCIGLEPFAPGQQNVKFVIYRP